MQRKKRTSDPCGIIDRGRITFHRHEHEVIQTWLRVRLGQARNARDAAKRAHTRMRTAQSLHQLSYWENVVAWCEGMLRCGTKSCELTDWIVEYREVSTRERHTQSVRTDTPTIPGME